MAGPTDGHLSARPWQGPERYGRRRVVELSSEGGHTEKGMTADEFLDWEGR